MSSAYTFEEEMNKKDPYEIFRDWLEAARKVLKNTFVAYSFCLTTADEQGRPSARFVTLTGMENGNLYFMSNSSSRKGQHLSKNPQVACTFHWPGTFRMVNIDAIVEQGTLEMADEIFDKRPQKQKIWAHVCDQGNTIHNLQILHDVEKVLIKKFGDEAVPRPPTWVIYIIKPKAYHFFLSQKNFKHDKVIFRKPEPGEKINEEYTHRGKNGWIYERVFP